MPTGKPATEPSTALVIGGGIVGLSCALALARRGMGVTLLAPRIMRGPASWVNPLHIPVALFLPLPSLSPFFFLLLLLFSLCCLLSLFLLVCLFFFFSFFFFFFSFFF